MAVGRAGSYPDYSSTSNSQYIPQLYARKAINIYREMSVIPYITNKSAENESDIKKMGDKVIYRKNGAVTTRSYSKGQEIDFESPEETAVELSIDRARYWAIKVDNIDKFQTDLDYMGEYAKEAAGEMVEAIDTQFLAAIFSDANASNYGATAGAVSANLNMGVSGTPRVLSRDNILYFFNDMGQTLDEKKVPKMGRHVTISPAIWNMIQSSDLKNANFSGMGKSFLLTGEAVHNISGFDIHVTNLLNYQTDGAYTTFDVVFNQEDAICFCSQITESDLHIKFDKTFGSGMKGLQVYDWVTTRSEGLGWAYVAVSN